jgi:hypothetical protein
MIAYTLNKINEMEKYLIIENQNDGLVEDQQRDIKYTKLFVLPRFTLGLIAQVGIPWYHIFALTPVSPLG